MIGNDIIDLSLAKTQSNWQRPGFLEKQFTEEEINCIQTSEEPFLLIWRMWSMKEAVYKVVVQQEQRRFFAPQKFSCEILSETEGSVTYQNQVFQTQTQTTRKYIYTSTGNATFYWIGENTKSANMWKAIEKQTGFSTTQLDIRKTVAGVPNLFYKEERISQAFTKTHHGDYEAIEYIQTQE